MAAKIPKVLLLGHSFIRRLKCDLQKGFDSRASRDFKLRGTAEVHLHGIGGLTVDRLRRLDLQLFKTLAPEVIILELGTNDLSSLPPEVVGSAIEDLVNFILKSFHVQVVGVCLVIPRASYHLHSTQFAHCAEILNKYLEVVLEPIPNVFCWCHRAFKDSCKPFYLPDGVHVNPAGQYQLYRSYRGAILKATSFL